MIHVTSGAAHGTRDRGAVDVSIEMLFGMVALLLAVLLISDATAYWHARNVYDEAAAEGARIAAAHGARCDDGVFVARAMIDRHAGTWGAGVSVACTRADIVTVTVRGRTPGVLSAGLGFEVGVSKSQPREP